MCMFFLNKQKRGSGGVSFAFKGECEEALTPFPAATRPLLAFADSETLTCSGQISTCIP